MSATPITFLKGHGTENDFVLIPDREDHLVLTEQQVRAICDRRAGLGGDGVIRVAPAGNGHYFMDYRNADGSLAQMCGNGARLFARFLVDAGWEPPGRFTFGTRGGDRGAELGAGGDVAIEMGAVRIGPSSSATVDGRSYPGLAVDVGNPHLACRWDGDLDELDLSHAPGYDRVDFPEGVNIEFFVPVGPDEVRMRVYERGVGETRSCGTGTVAVAAAHLSAQGRSAGQVRVQVLGGTVEVALDSAGSPEVAFGGATLTGPAVFVASGTLDPTLLSAG